MKYALLALILTGCITDPHDSPQPTSASTAASHCLKGGTWTGTVCEYDDPKPPKP